MFQEFKRILKAIFTALGAFAGLLVLLIIGVLIYEKFNQDQRVAGLLNITDAPSSLEVLKCKTASFLTTDTIITCGIIIEPKEFPLLLKGYNFKKRSTKQISYSVGEYGLENFEITEGYHIEPKWFKYGGSIDIYTNQHHRRAFVNYYRE